MKPIVTLKADNVGMICVFIGNTKFGVFDQIDGNDADYCWFPCSTEKLSGDAIIVIGEKLSELNAQQKGVKDVEQELVDVKDLYLISGDDGTVHIVSAKDTGDATSSYEAQVRNDCRYPDEDVGMIFVTVCVQPLKQAIENHI